MEHIGTIEPRNAPQTTSPPSTPHSRWVAEQLAILAEAFGEALTPVRILVYVQDLEDLAPEQLAVGFARARREFKFFPRISELRTLAGASADDVRKIEAELAWKFATDYLREWGVTRLPIREKGRFIEAPPIPPRIEYALRRIGGLAGLNQITEQSRPFVFKDFCEAYALAPIAESLAPRLAAQSGMALKGLPEASTNGEPLEERRAPKVLKEFPESTQTHDRREVLRQQVELLAKQRAGQRDKGE